MDEAMSCSYCKERFSDSIKLIPECGNSICGDCYDILREDIDEQSNPQYKCPACGHEHLMLRNGLPDNKQLLRLLQSLPEKPLHENAKTLKSKLSEVDDQMKKLQLFDGRQAIELHCDQLELEVSESTASAIKHLREIEEKQMKQIREYREKCMQKLSNPNNTRKLELTALKREVSEFNAKWIDYFTRIEAYEKEEDIEAALYQANQYVSKMHWIEEKMRKDALGWEKMVFKENSQFLKDWNHTGEIKFIAEPRDCYIALSTSSSNEMASRLAEKNISIQTRASFTLTNHSDSVLQVMFLPDGRLASCSYDKTIKIWNVENGEELFELKTDTSSMFSLESLPNGFLASGTNCGNIIIWDLEQRNWIRIIYDAHSSCVLSLRLLKNGNLASYSRDNTVKFWSLNGEQSEPCMRGHENKFHRRLRMFGVLSNDYMVTCSRHEGDRQCIIRVWNPNEPTPIKSVPTGFNDATSLLVLANDQVALGSQSGSIKIVDINDQALTRVKQNAHDNWVTSFVQLSNGNLVSVGVDGAYWTIKVWNLINWRTLQTIKTGHSSLIWSICISADEKFLASADYDETIKLWPISTE